MGQEIEKTHFNERDYRQFRARLTHETEHAARAYACGEFAETDFVAGFELEAWLTDRNFFPVPRNAQVLERVLGEFVVTRQWVCGKGLGNAAAICRNSIPHRQDEVYQPAPQGCSH